MQEFDPETIAMLRLCLCDGVGNVSVHRLLGHFGSAQAALAASPQELAEVEGLPPGAARALRQGSSAGAADEELARVQKADVRLLPISSPDYPAPLRYLEDDAPPLLWMMGGWERRDQLSVAVVGSRRPTHYGLGQTRRFASGLASMGFTIVSGLARGTDSEAHRAALRAGGRTVAVLGSGLRALTERAEIDLADWIAQNGAVLSELPLTTPPRGANFPPRNRIISGLSLGVLVMEAAARSGTLITARWAGEQGKSVFALPGPVDSPTSQGAHALIRDGAILVRGPQDVVEALGPLAEPLELAGPDVESGESVIVEDARTLMLNEREKQVHDMLGSVPQQVDEIIAAAGLPSSIVASVLLTLEIRGLARRLPGQRYVLP